jgi:hypothetical protein
VYFSYLSNNTFYINKTSTTTIIIYKLVCGFPNTGHMNSALHKAVFHYSSEQKNEILHLSLFNKTKPKIKVYQRIMF